MNSAIAPACRKEGQRRGCSPAASQAACLSPGPLKVTNTTELCSTDKYTAPWSWRIRISDRFPHSDPSLTYQLLLMQLWWHLEPHRTIFLCPVAFSPHPLQVFSCVSILAQAYMPQLLKKKKKSLLNRKQC